MERKSTLLRERAWALRGVVFTQIALVAFIGAACRGNIDLAESVVAGPSDGPEWVEKAVGLTICIVFYLFPIWGIVAAW